MSDASARPLPTVVLGAPIDDVTMDEAVDRIFAMIDQARTSGRSHQVATVNVDFLVNAIHDPSVLELLQRTDLSIPDGMPIVWGSRLLGNTIRERVAGADLVPALATRAAATQRRMFLFGAAPGIADRAAAILRDQNPGLDVVADSGPSFNDPADMDPAFLDVIAAAAPDICCVALGNPKQERWIELYRDRLRIPVSIGVGGTLDFIAGDKARAPAWLQRNGLEWLHRAATEPGRLAKRYAKDTIVFGPHFARQAWRTRPVRRQATCRPVFEHGAGRLRIGFSGTSATLDDHELERAMDAIAAGDDVLLEYGGHDRIEGLALALIVELSRRADRFGTTVRLSTVSVRLRRLFDECGLARLVDHTPGNSTTRSGSQPLD